MQGVANKSIEASFWIDQAIPLIPFFIVFYMAGYFFVFYYAYKEENQERFDLAISSYFLLLTLSFIIFKFFPIQMHKTFALNDDFFSRLTFSQQRFDTNLNNFPSLHVSINLFTFLMLRPLLGPRAKQLALLFTAAIIGSTLLVKQHLFVDVLGGLFMGSLFYYLQCKLSPKLASFLRPLKIATTIIICLLIASQYESLQIMLQSLGRYLGLFSGQ